MKRGCRRPRRFGLALEDYITPVFEPPPLELHNGDPTRIYPMLGNASYSDCVEAAGLHARQDWNAAIGKAFAPTDGMALDDYAIAAGFKIGDESTDNGTMPDDYMAAWRRGLPGAGKILGFVQIDPGDATQMMLANQHFGGVFFCAELPDAADDARVWSLKQCYGQPSGGHGFWVNGHDATMPNVMYDNVTWGELRVAGMDEAFANFYGFTAYAALTEDWQPKSDAISPKLITDLAALKNI